MTVRLLILIVAVAVSPFVRSASAVDAATIDASVTKGLEALVAMQNEDGSFGTNPGITALAGMALLSGGHTPTRGSYAEASRRALASVLAAQDNLTGYLAGSSNMYAHGFATLYLAEAFGMSGDLTIKPRLEAALDVIYRAQNSEGGWRYTPEPVDADVSVTICQVKAIRAAYNVGVGGEQSINTMAAAIGYVRSCANPNGSFSYQAGRSSMGIIGAPAVPRAAAGAMCLIGAGISPQDPVLAQALVFLDQHVGEHLAGTSHWYWYGQYYAAQAMFHHPDPQVWQRYYDQAAPIIIGHQSVDGSWNHPDNYGAAFATPIALIILQIPNQYLPIFQR